MYIYIYICGYTYLFIRQEDTKNRKNIAGILNCNVLLYYRSHCVHVSIEANDILNNIDNYDKIDKNRSYLNN